MTTYQTTEPTTAPTSSDRQREILDRSLSGLALAAGAANVIMQLSWPAVGHGVVESRVPSGQVFRHPLKRTRTTLSYIAVAGLGTEEEKAVLRRGVNRAHAQVRSTPDSPVTYNAFDPDLQLWVAACIYRGFEDTYRLFVGPLDDATHDLLYEAGTSMGTTLQARREIWPADRAAFEQYWQTSLEKVSIDDTVRSYLHDVAALKPFGPVVSALFGRLNLFLTAGFLPEQFREEMQMTWTARDQRRFDRLVRTLAALNKPMPRQLRQFPFNYFLRNARLRVKHGTEII